MFGGELRMIGGWGRSVGRAEQAIFFGREWPVLGGPRRASRKP